MKRVVIAGVTGTGKTTLARDLSQKMQADFVDLDELNWLPQWVTRNSDDFLQLVDAAIRRDCWVVSGNYRAARPRIWGRADTVIFLDYPFWFSLVRLVRRSILRIVDKKPICNGNFETLPKFLSRDSIVLWFFKTYWRRKRDMRQVLDNPQDYPYITFLRFQSHKETQAWLKQISFPPSPSKT